MYFVQYPSNLSGYQVSVVHLVCEDGNGKEHAKVMEMRAELIDHVPLFVQSEGWTQAQAAERFGVAQSRVSDLLTGKTEKFSLDMLITLASRVGCKVELAVE